jgi:hypothetical protein
MAEGLELRARPSGAERCAVCHGDFEAEPFVCESCDARFHRDCRATLGRCSTLGCKAGKPWERVVRSPVSDDAGWIARIGGLAFAALALAVSFATGAAYGLAASSWTADRIWVLGFALLHVCFAPAALAVKRGGGGSRAALMVVTVQLALLAIGDASGIRIYDPLRGGWMALFVVVEPALAAILLGRLLWSGRALWSRDRA